MTLPLKGKVAVVSGGTRGAGRAIAVSLGEAGATVYITGRSIPGSTAGRPETIDETAAMVTTRGGIGIPVRVDHTVEKQVSGLFERISEEQGRLDLLVNDIWGGDELTEWETPFWEHSLQNGLRMQERAVNTHLITSYYAMPLMLNTGGLVIEVTDGVGYDYRGSLFYSLAKVSTIHLAQAMAADFQRHGTNLTAVALTPGFLRSEAVLDAFRVTEANWTDASTGRPDFAASETPYFIGRAVVALATDPNVAQKTGRTLSTWDLAKEYGFTDLDGTRPDWGTFFRENIQPEGTAGMLHHVEINGSNLQTSSEFWGWLLEFLGYESYQSWSRGRSWRKGGTYIVLAQTESEYRGVAYHRKGTGLNHLAFHAGSRKQVDELTTALLDRGVRILYEDRHPHAGGSDHYAVFFEDPDRIKVEVVAP